MTHEEFQDLLSAYLDGELPDATELEGHLSTCAACTARLAEYRQVSAAVGATLRRQAAAEPAPAALRERVAAALAAADATATRRAPPNYYWGRGALAAVAAVLLVAIGVRLGTGRSADDVVAREVLDSHIRAMAGDEAHLMDIVSTDQHTVKPWFEGKLDFAPTVQDFAVQGFPLLGGRVDYVDGRRAAALIYGRRLHKINVYEWPTTGISESNPVGELRLGYSMLHWTHAGIAYWAVSDVSPADLQELARNIDTIGR